MSDAPEKKKRSPVERLIVWGLIGVLLVVMLIEYRASRNFNAASQTMSEMQRPTLDELKGQISGETVSEPQTDKLGTSEVEFSFFSFFKADKYKLRVQLADIPKDGGEELIAKLSAGGGTVVDFYQPDALAEAQDHRATVSNPQEDDSSDDITAGTGGMGGGAGGAPDHGDGSDAGAMAGGGRPGGGGGNRRGRGNRGMSAIAANPEVRTKLNITDEQAEKIKTAAESNQFDFSSMRDMEPAEQKAAVTEYRAKIANGIKEVLDAEQFDTIQRMTWAQEGPRALVQASVATRIGLTEDQVAELAKIREGMDLMDWFRNPPVDEMLAILKDEQKTKWSELIEGMEPPAPPEGEQRPARPPIEE